jgi:hypothetical protein
MSQRSLILVILVAIGALVGLFMYYSDQTKRYNWSESDWFQRSYSETSEQPYGTLMLHRLLENYLPDQQLKDIKRSISLQLPLDSTGSSNFIFVGESMFLDSLSRQHLLEFVKKGNTAFLSLKIIPPELLDTLIGRQCLEEPMDYMSITDTYGSEMSLSQPEVKGKFQFVVQNVPQSYSWHYFNARSLCQENAPKVIGQIKPDLPNFIKAPFGAGHFLLHTNPIVFSNYSMLQLECRPYITGVLSHLNAGPLYWDAISRSPLDESAAVHPLSYILEQKSLAWAWYLLVSLGLIWVIFGSKRKQKPIPILPKNENSSLEFIQTIAHLHFRKKNFRGQAVQSMKLFLAQLRERYGMAVWMDNDSHRVKTDTAFFQRLTRLTQISENDIRVIFTKYEHCLQYEPTESMMTDLYLSFEEFLKKAK